METELQDRYVVMKAEDIDGYLNESEKIALDGILGKINSSRTHDNKRPVQGVFIGESFAEYEGVKLVLLNRINEGDSLPGLDIFQGWRVGDVFYQFHSGSMSVNMGIISRLRYIETESWKNVFADAEIATRAGVHRVSDVNIQSIHRCPISAVAAFQSAGMEALKATRDRLLARPLPPQKIEERKEAASW